MLCHRSSAIFLLFETRKAYFANEYDQKPYTAVARIVMCIAALFTLVITC